MLVVSPVTLLMKDQVESFGSEVSKRGQVQRKAPSTVTNADLSRKGPFIVFEVAERTAKKMGSRLYGQGRMLQSLLWAVGEWKKLVHLLS